MNMLMNISSRYNAFKLEVCIVALDWCKDTSTEHYRSITETYYILNSIAFFKAVEWVRIMVSLDRPDGRLGYEKARATLYMHAMVYHVPRFMVMHKGIKKFTGQGK